MCALMPRLKVISTHKTRSVVTRTAQRIIGFLGGITLRRTLLKTISSLVFSGFSLRLFAPVQFEILVIENCNKITTQQQWHRRRADKLSAAARRSTKVGGGAHKFSAAARRGRRMALSRPTHQTTP